MRADVQVDSAAARDRLDQVAARMLNLQSLLKEVGDELRDHYRDAYASGADWDPLSEDTVRIKGNSQRLVDQGILLRSMTRRGARYADHQVNADSVTVATTDPVVSLLLNPRGGARARDPAPPVGAARVRRLVEILERGLVAP